MTRDVALGLQFSREHLLREVNKAHNKVRDLREKLKQAEEELRDYRRAHENVVAALEADLSPLLEASLDAMPERPARHSTIPSGVVFLASAPVTSPGEKP